MTVHQIERDWASERDSYEKLYFKENLEWIKYLVALAMLQSSALIAAGEKLFADRKEYQALLFGAVAAFLVVVVSGVFAYTGILCFYRRVMEYCLYRVTQLQPHSESCPPPKIETISPPVYTRFAILMQIFSFLAAMILCFAYLLLCFLR